MHLSSDAKCIVFASYPVKPQLKPYPFPVPYTLELQSTWWGLSGKICWTRALNKLACSVLGARRTGEDVDVLAERLGCFSSTPKAWATVILAPMIYPIWGNKDVCRLLYCWCSAFADGLRSLGLYGSSVCRLSTGYNYKDLPMEVSIFYLLTGDYSRTW